jgi:hypothetical protein
MCGEGKGEEGKRRKDGGFSENHTTRVHFFGFDGKTF